MPPLPSLVFVLFHFLFHCSNIVITGLVTLLQEVSGCLGFFFFWWWWGNRSHSVPDDSELLREILSLCFLSDRIKGVCHHQWLLLFRVAVYHRPFHFLSLTMKAMISGSYEYREEVQSEAGQVGLMYILLFLCSVLSYNPHLFTVELSVPCWLEWICLYASPFPFSPWSASFSLDFRLVWDPVICAPKCSVKVIVFSRESNTHL